MTHANRQTLIEQIEALPATLNALLAGRTAAELERPYGEGKWNTRQLVHHLADAHMYLLHRVHLILTEERPALIGWKQDAFAALPDALASMEPSLAILGGVHKRVVTCFRALSEEQYARIGIHPVRGEMTVEACLTLVATHGSKHLDHIRAALGA